MSKWIKETEIVKQIAASLTSANKNKYSDDILSKFLPLKIAFKLSHLPHLQRKSLKITNTSGQILDALVIRNRQAKNKTCILYLHGFGSNKLEAVSILSHLPSQIDLCSFDFSGSGRSQGNLNTFGLKQSLDICKCSFTILGSVIQQLKDSSFGYSKFILWGRSMGAVASFLFTTSKDQECQKYKKDVIYQILDSSFCSFESVCYHQGKQWVKLPQMFISYGIQILKDYFKDFDDKLNPFTIDLEGAAKSCYTPSLFVYNQQDSMIPSENSYKMIHKLPKQTYFEKFLINENHNSLRRPDTISKIFISVKKYHSKILYQNKRPKVADQIQRKDNVLSNFFKSSQNTPKKNMKIVSSLKNNRLRMLNLNKSSQDFSLDINKKQQHAHSINRTKQMKKHKNFCLSIGKRINFNPQEEKDRATKYSSRGSSIKHEEQMQAVKNISQ